MPEEEGHYYIRSKTVKRVTYYYKEQKVFNPITGKWTTKHLGKASPEDIEKYGEKKEPIPSFSVQSRKIAGKFLHGQKITVELFSGTESFSKVAREHGYATLTIDNDRRHHPDLCLDILDLTPEMVRQIVPDISILWASPPCQCFSRASMAIHWKKDSTGNRIPQDDQTRTSIKLVEHTLHLIKELEPEFWIIENPVGMLQYLQCVKNLPKKRVHYCKYGDDFQKPTHIITNIDQWIPRPRCRKGDPCHEAAPRGSNTGLQNGSRSPIERAIVPPPLIEELFSAMEGNQKTTQKTLSDIPAMEPALIPADHIDLGKSPVSCAATLPGKKEIPPDTWHTDISVKEPALEKEDIPAKLLEHEKEDISGTQDHHKEITGTAISETTARNVQEARKRAEDNQCPPIKEAPEKAELTAIPEQPEKDEEKEWMHNLYMKHYGNRKRQVVES